MAKRFSTSDVTSLGVSLSEFTKRFKLSHKTLKRLDERDPGIRDYTWGRAERGLAILRAELEVPRRRAAEG